MSLISIVEKNKEDILTKINADDFFNALSYADDNELEYISNNIDLKKLFSFNKKTIRKIAFYYHRLYNGGIEKVVCNLANMFINNGYDVCIITDEGINDLDYDINKKINRIALNCPHQITEREEIYNRLLKIRKTVIDNQIDCVIYNSWMAPQMCYDLLSIKSANSYSIVYNHGSFISSIVFKSQLVFNKMFAYSFADYICVLSDTDRVFWSTVNKNVYKVTNPYDESMKMKKYSARNNHNVIWIGRADDPIKNLDDCLYIIEEVSKEIEDVKLIICGSMNDGFKEYITNLINKLHINRNIEIVGFDKNVNKYLLEASVMLFTSSIEGSPLCVNEALHVGLPIVAYENSYLSYFKESKAVIETKYKDIDETARQLKKLLLDIELQNKLSKNAITYSKRFDKIDIFKEWKELLSLLVKDKHIDIKKSEYMEYFYNEKQLFKKINYMICNNGKEEFEQIINSRTYKIGNAIMYIPKKIKDFLKTKL